MIDKDKISYIFLFSDKRFIILIMCQCLCCDCWWFNYCGVCAGCHHAYLLCSFWCCKHPTLAVIDPFMCHCCECVGLGHNTFCMGSVMCAPQAVVTWSKLVSSGQNIVIQAPPPASDRVLYPQNGNQQYPNMR
jgi:hypothetical protein